MTERLPRGCVTTLVIIFLAALIDGLDVSIVTVSIPTMAGEFGVSLSDSSWIVFAYVAGLAALLLPMGKFAKNGRVKRFMILGTALFGASSLACGLSGEYWILILFRMVQGVAAAMMSSVLPSMVVHMLPPDRKGLGMSVMGASSGLALILGPVIGGVIADNFHWGWLFFINVPICVVIVALAAAHMPKDRERDPEKDPTLAGGISAMLLVGSLLAILEDFGDPDIEAIGRAVCAIIAVPSAAVLVWSIKRDARKAVISPKMLRNREFIVIGTAFLLCTMVVSGGQYLLPYMLQGYWSLSPLESGLYLSAVSVAMILLVLPVGRMCDRFGCKWPSAAAPILRGTFCALMIYLTIEGCEPIFLLIPLAIFGASHAFSGTAQPTRMIHHATPGYEDEATNFMLVVNYVASALGCVLFAMVFSLFSGGGPADIGTDGLKDGFVPTMWFSLIILAIALACTLSVRNKVVKAERE